MMSAFRVSIPLVFLVSAVSVFLQAESPQPDVAIQQTVCGIALHPQAYRGARVSLRGRVYESLGKMYLRGESCPESVRLIISKPLVDPRSRQHISDFHKYVSARVRRRAKNAACTECNRYRVEGTVFGRVSLELQHAAGSVQAYRAVLTVDDVSGLEAEDLYGSFYSAAQYEPELTRALNK